MSRRRGSRVRAFCPHVRRVVDFTALSTHESEGPDRTRCSTSCSTHTSHGIHTTMRAHALAYVLIGAPACFIRGAPTQGDIGVGVSPKTSLCSDLTDADNLNGTGWIYNWGLTPSEFDDCDSVPDIEFIPQCWGRSSCTSLDGLDDSYLTKDSTTMLFSFNEPDNSGQSDMDPSEAAALWPTLGKHAPSTASPSGG